MQNADEQFVKNMPPFTAILLWPLRKAAVLPAIAIGSLAAGAAFGSYDLSRRAASALVAAPAPPAQQRGGTGSFAAAASLTVTALVVAAREALFAPAPVPSPRLPLDDSVPLAQRLRNAARLVVHHTRHYPLRFRFTTAFVAGAVGGFVHPLAVAHFNAGGGMRAPGEGEK